MVVGWLLRNAPNRRFQVLLCDIERNTCEGRQSIIAPCEDPSFIKSLRTVYIQMFLLQNAASRTRQRC
jgi:hypothetical protein